MSWATPQPIEARSPQPAASSRLVALLKACGVRLVILDDFHHLLNVPTKSKLDEVSDFLKVLIKESGVPFLVVGVDNKVDLVLKSNKQLSRLFAARQRLEPFTWGSDNEASSSEFESFVRYAVGSLGLPIMAGLDTPDLLYRLHYASSGVVAHVMNLLRYAQQTALERGSNVIALSDLATGYDARLRDLMPRKINPFILVSKIKNGSGTAASDSASSGAVSGGPATERPPASPVVTGNELPPRDTLVAYEEDIKSQAEGPPDDAPERERGRPGKNGGQGGNGRGAKQAQL